MTANGRIRIIGGSLRNSRLEVPDLPGLRPTTDRVRETLFNWLQPVIGGARCLDLFAGTGALGIEALSRGAAMVTFVERDARLAAALRANLARLKVQAAVVGDDAVRWLKAGGKPADVVFMDPPFAGDLWGDAADALESHGWLAPSAWIYVEAPRTASSAVPPTWQVHRQGVAGEVAYTLYRRTPDVPLS
ncbi:16S rRNA (guanine(966)-N(2))-methyltransferase RsmD [Luteibacter aegosomatissinici]|uniref:16S rRNA (guanine(966)-N(2))-methyltransferase RsmD n=1 Tax=Luteibacter aegosomatissinici TaxID=2911539 RepID=UPI001FF7D46A|nr:16S rRNA (guanine(966)-N(2))-methyltransferase RsmD [Luteibacter aegosomatissinici]UPG93518.1 16S rRNA (guanine(966)-N(2))-methyltransferase RsmD [Luteibacter aegosomatissinici]